MVPGDRLRAGRQLCQEGGYAAGAEVVEPSPPWFDRDAHLLLVHRPDVAFECRVRVRVHRFLRPFEVLVGDAVDGLQMREAAHQKAFRGGGSITNTLTFWYKVSASALTNPEPGLVTNWLQVSNLTFVSPTVLTNATALNGNASSNRQVFSAVLVSELVLPPGQNLFFRWRDLNDSGADQGMALDDLAIGFSLRSLQITSIVRNSSNGFVQLTGLGESNLTYGIEAASNLNSPVFWQRIGSNTADSAGVFQFTDTNAPPLSARFYRALYP